MHIIVSVHGIFKSAFVDVSHCAEVNGPHCTVNCLQGKTKINVVTEKYKDEMNKESSFL